MGTWNMIAEMLEFIIVIVVRSRSLFGTGCIMAEIKR